MSRAFAAVMVAIGFISTLTVCAGGGPAGGDRDQLRLQGPEWVVEDIAGGGVIDRSRATLNFGADGRVFGNASCNNYMGEYAVTGEQLTVAKVGATKKGCVQAVMRQEQLFLDVLQKAQRFSLSPEGALILHADDGRTLTARR